MHAKGAGAYGYFEASRSLSDYTRADFLSEARRRTELFVRFSTVGGEKGSADAERDPRGFAVKLYTQEGNYDLVMNNTPVFFIRDPLKFPDFIHTQKRHPATNAKDADMFWDFLSLTPESIHQVTILFSDRGTPASYRNINGYSGHTFKWYNNDGKYVWVKYHFKTKQGIKNLTRQEASKLIGENADHATLDLYDAIKRGHHPQWTVYVQIMEPEAAKTYKYDPFDITKVWPHGDYPLQEIGTMVLDRNPENYFAEVEQAAFSPGSFVPGIGPSPDKMLQGRLFAYPDAHRYRLGANYHLLPVNSAKAAKVNNYQRDGFMRFDSNEGAKPNYYPNSFNGPQPRPELAEPETDLSGKAKRHPYTHTNDDFEQAGALYSKVMSDYDRNNLIGNIASHISKAQKRIQKRQCALFYKASSEYGIGVAEALGLDIKEIETLAKMPQEDRVKATEE
ncbi:Catalase-like subgroup-containing protein [Candidatus Magnetoovum chiemensis]|nr:Catalase-like subgroup-containing protein [Candidatus Magnetoovum chiemensis]